ncbi:MAG: DUF4097 family beta strand repeat-containing protein [Colwellia sp.]
MKQLTKLFSMSFVVATSLAFSQSSLAFEDIDKSLSAKDLTNVAIEIRMGEVDIIGWDKNEVHVSGELDKEVTEFVFREENGQILIKTKYESSKHSGSTDTDLTVKVPKTLRVNFDGVSGDIRLTDLLTNTRVNSVSGDVKAKTLRGSVELSSVSGSIKAESLEGKIRLSSVSGDISDKGSKGRLMINSVSGDITSQSSALEVAIESVSGEVELKLGKVDEVSVSTVNSDIEAVLALQKNGSIKTNTVSGDAVIQFNNDVAGDFRLHASAGGRITNQITQAKEKRSKYGPNSKLNFQTGDASTTIIMNTVSGKLVVK